MIIIPLYVASVVQDIYSDDPFTYNPILLNFYEFLKFDFLQWKYSDLAKEYSKVGAIFDFEKGNVVFLRDEDATLFLLRFA